ncbi:MAG: L-serine ammonia-lyase, iron-sulfur-dependent subunit beta [Pyramidobacter sp.]|nr:L-serine ammonia-lyase, iron-sulfur-dependent subunit beta [Pyramidobacter sp.]
MDIIGPVMIGPSSSHTAGAVRIGQLARRIWGWNRPLRSVRLFLRGSFAATYWGHGTDRGLIAGVLRMSPDDERIPDAFSVARESGLEFSFSSEEIDGAHPNSVRLVMSDGESACEVVGASVGGGAVELHEIDGFSLKVSFDMPSLISFHDDVPGVIAGITGELYRRGLNLARMELNRRSRGDIAAAVFSLDGHVPEDLAECIKNTIAPCRRAILLLGPEDGGNG